MMEGVVVLVEDTISGKITNETPPKLILFTDFYRHTHYAAFNHMAAWYMMCTL